MTSKIENHVEKALARLPGKLNGPEKISQLLSILSQESQNIEEAFWQLFTERGVDTAEGVTLDAIGNLVGQKRGGLDDDNYRRLVRARISVNRSKGKQSDILKIARSIIDDPNAHLILETTGAAAATLTIEGIVLTNDVANFVIDFISDAVVAGVRILLETPVDIAEELFTLGISSFASAPLSIGNTTIPVNSTVGFPATGSLVIDAALSVEEVCTYTGISPTSFLGVSSLVSNHTSGAAVQLSTGPGKGCGSTLSDSTGGRYSSIREFSGDDRVVIPGEDPVRDTITPIVLTSGSSTTDGATSPPTASITPTANRPILAVVDSANAGGPNIATATGNGLTWQNVGSVLYASGTRRITVLRSLGASPTTGAITFDFAAQSQTSFAWCVIEFDGADITGTNGSGAIVQTVTNSALAATTITATLAAFEDPTNVNITFVGTNTVAGITPDADFTELTDNSVASGNLALESEWADNEVSCTPTFATTDVGIISVEIKSGIV